jgi:hypothetical protein
MSTRHEDGRIGKLFVGGEIQRSSNVQMLQIFDRVDVFLVG